MPAVETVRDRARTAIVTGAAGGLGGAIARRLLADGLLVVAADLDVTGLEASLAAPGRAFAHPVDVTDPASVSTLVAAANERFERVDVLVNAAGIAGLTSPVADYPVDDWRRVIEVNLVGVFICTRACLPGMVAWGYGRMVNIASIAGRDPNADMSAYSASKAGVIAFTKSVAKEVATTGVLVNALVPGVIRAGLTAKTTEDERRLFLSRVPMGRMGEPEEVAELASWLASPRCSFSTGAAFDLSGGRAVN
jgi:NAD(P)-dependent dehydrogenase (short-subunit alcohol dehydrogenase family)